MTFFKLVGITLGAIALLNLIQVSVEMSMRHGVYACSDIGKYNPPEDQKLCRRFK
jgi:hypothetical protein